MLDFLRRLFGFHDSYGLKHSTEHLNAIADEIVFWPLREQEKYADGVIVERIGDILFLNQQVMNRGNIPAGQKLNATAIGNLAYVHLHAPTHHLRQKALEILRDYQRRLKKGQP